MKVNNFFEPFDHLIIDDILDPHEYDGVFNEILLLKNALQDNSHTGSSWNLNENGEVDFKKRGSGVWIDSVYTQRIFSNILTYTNKIFNQKFYNEINYKNWFYKSFLPITTKDCTLLQCYDDGDFYAAHSDEGLMTSVTLIHKTPKEYTGGELMFPGFENFTVDLKNNQMIIFPAPIIHEVLPVKKQTSNFDGNRFTLTKFISYDGKRNSYG